MLMKYFFFLLIFASISSFAVAQDAVAPVFNAADSITHLNPDVSVLGKSIFKRFPNKTGNKTLKLSLWAGKLYVIKASGDVQPYTVKSCELLVPVNAGTQSLKIRGVLNSATKAIMENAAVGWKFRFQNIIIENSSGQAMSGIVESLLLVKVK